MHAFPRFRAARCPKRLLGGTVTAFLFAAAAVWLVHPRYGDASSHREAPLISEDPQADNTDVYAFVSPDDPSTVTMIANYYPLEEPGGGPNFFQFGADVLYEMMIDNDGDAVEDLVYRFIFQDQVQNPNTFLYSTGVITDLNDPDYNRRQIYDLIEVDVNQGTTSVLGSGLRVPPVNIGPRSTPNYEQIARQAVNDLPDGIKAFAGQRDDPFFIDLAAIFDLGTIRPGPPGAFGGGVDGLAGFNVHTMALQIPIDRLTADKQLPTGPDDNEAVIGVWAQARRRAATVRQPDGSAIVSSNFVRVSRLGMPLVNEVLIPIGVKDLYNASHPSADAQFSTLFTDPEAARVLNLRYGINIPSTPRSDILSLIFVGVAGVNVPLNAQSTVVADLLRVNTGIPPKQPGDPGYSTKGVFGGDLAGFPNGRRLEDDVVDVMERVVGGGLLSGTNMEPNTLLGDGVQANDKPFINTFPYVGTPHAGFDHESGHHPVSSSTQ